MSTSFHNILFILNLFHHLHHCIKVCSTTSCNIAPTIDEKIYVCTNQVSTCVLQCNYQKCKLIDGLTLYSFASNTLIQCAGKDSCQNKNFYIGKPSNIMPNELTNVLSSFNTNLNTLIIECPNELSCSKTNIYVNGLINNNFIINSQGLESMKHSMIQCNINVNSLGKCLLNCGKNSCINTEYECSGEGNCECNGLDCPTIDPITQNMPSSKHITKHCESDPCKFEPNGNMIVVCDNSINTCIIDCAQKQQQCKFDGEGLIVYSAAKNTIIQCGVEDACGGAIFNIGMPDKIPSGYNSNQFNNIQESLYISCIEKASCKETMININGFIKQPIIIDALGYDAFQKSELYCNINKDQTCQLNCNNLNYASCEFSKYHCLNGNCYCIGDSCCTGFNYGDYCKGILIDKPKMTISPSVSPTFKPINKNNNNDNDGNIVDDKEYCNNGVCFIKAVSGYTYICTNSNKLCLLKCENNCDNIKLYSASLTTKIECVKCKNNLYSIGLPNNIPNNYNKNNFISIKKQFNLTCINCTNIDLNIHSEFEINSNINIIGNIIDSNIECNLINNNINNNVCNLNCNDNGCNNVDIICVKEIEECSKNINCIGEGCNNLGYIDINSFIDPKNNKINIEIYLLIIGISIICGLIFIFYFCIKDYTLKKSKKLAKKLGQQYSTQNCPKTSFDTDMDGNKTYSTFEIQSILIDDEY